MDGLHRSQRCVSSGSNASGIQEVSKVHGVRQSVPIQGPLLWSVHGSAGLHAGHGSGFGNSPQSWRSTSMLPGRLADAGVLPGAGPTCSEDSSPVVQLFGDCRQLGEVSACPDSDNMLPGNSVNFQASPAQKRVDKLLSIGDVFLSSVDQPAKSWLELLGVLSSLTQLIPGGRLWMRSFQFALHRAWDRLDTEALVRWSPAIRQNLLWWLDRERLELGISLEQVSLQLDLWSDTSDVGWGGVPRRGCRFRALVSRGASQLHKPSGAVGSFLCAPAFSSTCSQRHFLPLVRNTSVAVFADNTTALAYLKNQGGTRSAVLNRTERHSITLLPQFIMGRNNVLADALSRPNQILGS